MKQYKGAVFFVDILGVGDLTRKRIKISSDDYAARGIFSTSGQTEQVFCAKLLTTLRASLRHVKRDHARIKIAQLSDCAFMWSADTFDVVDASRQLMWLLVRAGLLCRGGIAFGEIVEPDKVDQSIGQFVLGEAVTKAASQERVGKGCRIFSDEDLPPALLNDHRFEIDPFAPLKNPLDGSTIDEFRWYLFRRPMRDAGGKLAHPKESAIGLMELAVPLMHSPSFGWNASTPAGATQLASSVESISMATKLFIPTDEYCFHGDRLIQHPPKRSSKVCEGILSLYKADISALRLGGRKVGMGALRRKGANAPK